VIIASKEQFNLQNLRLNRIGYLAENIYFLPQTKASRKVHSCLHYSLSCAWTSARFFGHWI